MDLPTPAAPTPQAEPAEEAEYAIGASVSLQERRFRTLKAGDMFGVFDQSGNVLPSPGGTEGIYWRDTRYLSALDLLINDCRPMLLSSTLRDDNGTLTVDLTNPDLIVGREQSLKHDVIHLRRSRFLWAGNCHERLFVRNYSDAEQRVAIDIRFAADFADLFEVRGMTRQQHGDHHPPEVSADTAILSYTGLDMRRRETRLRFEPQPAVLDRGRAKFLLDLPAHGRALVFIEIACDADGSTNSAQQNFMRHLVESRRWMRGASAGAAAIATSNEVFNEAMRRSISDLYMLVTDKPTGPYPYAGVPWFSAAFGRDALITALQTLWLDPSLARGVLRYLARNQADHEDAAADAEPGKILHEVRHGEMAELGEVPFRRYYGSVDSTPLFVMLAGMYLERTGDEATLRELWPNIRRAIAWIEHSGDRDGDGFVEYFRRTDEGLANQGWKDSYDSVFHADGHFAEGPIALCEVQGYVYAARCAAAAIGRRLGFAGEAEEQVLAADKLRLAFEQAFWCEELGTYALALDGAKQPCRVRSSNAGHLLLAGILSPERALQVADGLLSSRFFTGWGIRTIANSEARYNPMAYHNGSVWPHDNALIALGMARYSLNEHILKLFGGLFDASLYIDLRRLPELFCGFPRRRGQGPTFYPVACSPQAWAATALPATLQAALGIGFDPPNRTVTFSNPSLPEFLREVTLHNLTIGEARLSVVFRRVGRGVSMNVLDRSGEIHAVMRS